MWNWCLLFQSVYKGFFLWLYSSQPVLLMRPPVCSIWYSHYTLYTTEANERWVSLLVSDIMPSQVAMKLSFIMLFLRTWREREKGIIYLEALVVRRLGTRSWTHSIGIKDLWVNDQGVQWNKKDTYDCGELSVCVVPGRKQTTFFIFYFSDAQIEVS